MAEPIYREYTSADISGLLTLWQKLFGDSFETVSCFFRTLPDTGTCFVAVCDGKIAGMASVLTDLRLNDGIEGRKCAYIYAVAVDSPFRGAGIGSTLSRMASFHAEKNGAEIIATLPADEGLYSMYEKTIGLTKTLKRKKISVSKDSTGSFSLRAAEPADYNRKREALLSSRPHISISDSSIKFLKTLCMENGGDIYVSGNRCAAFYVNHNQVFFSELLCPEDEADKLMADAAAFTGAERAYCYIPSCEGEKSIAYRGGKLEDSIIWNLTFE